jgi:hypothetical protein
MRARRRKLSAPARPADWRGHIARAFDGTVKVSLKRPLRDPRAKLLTVSHSPPRVLVDLLCLTNGLHDDGACCHILFGAGDIVARTRELRDETPRLAKLLVIGAPGVDGILFVMEEGAKSNRIGIWDPLDGAVRWLCRTLSEFLTRYGEDSLPL